MKLPNVPAEVDAACEKSSAHRKYKEDRARLDQLRDDLCTAKQQLHEIRTRPRDSNAEISEAVEAVLIRGSAAAATLAAPRAVSTEIEVEERRITVLERALDYGEHQLRDTNYRRSDEITEALAPLYRRIIEKSAAAAVELATYLALEEDLRRQCAVQDIRFGLRPMGFPSGIPTGRLDDRYSLINQWLHECREFGFVS